MLGKGDCAYAWLCCIFGRTNLHFRATYALLNSIKAVAYLISVSVYYPVKHSTDYS